MKGDRGRKRIHTADAMRRTFLRVLGITAGKYLHRFKRDAGASKFSSDALEKRLLRVATWILELT